MVQWLDLTWQLPSGIVIRIASYSDWVLYNAIFVDGEYDPALKKAFESVDGTKPLCIVDLGANVGFFTLRAVDLLRQSLTERAQFTIMLVEGHNRLLEELQFRIVAENALSKHVRVVHGLIGERIGTATLYEEPHHSNNSIFAGTARSGLRVDYVDLSSLFALEQEIDLLKCDIEGAELLFIQNYPDLLRRVRVAVFELHDHKCDTQQCRRLLDELGFTHQAVLRPGSPCSVYCVWR